MDRREENSVRYARWHKLHGISVIRNILAKLAPNTRKVIIESISDASVISYSSIVVIDVVNFGSRLAFLVEESVEYSPCFLGRVLSCVNDAIIIR